MSALKNPELLTKVKSKSISFDQRNRLHTEAIKVFQAVGVIHNGFDENMAWINPQMPI